jgi:ribosomal protein S18 acetylase RimI-like enzyme
VETWSPIEAKAISEEDSKLIIAKMYEEAAKRWVSVGGLDHALTIFAHNASVEKQLFNYGFGLRCIDAIRPMEKIESKATSNIKYGIAETKDYSRMAPLGRLLNQHLESSPMFMHYPDHYPMNDEIWLNHIINEEDVLYYYAEKDNKIVAYIKVADEGENFATEVEDMKSIQGACCYPEYRGQYIVQNLLNYIIDIYKEKGYKRLGVDFESFNPTARGFWLKYFTEYTHSLERRIDDRIR